CFFFFQAEDGIRDRNVTGVQTCALPISGQLVPLMFINMGLILTYLSHFGGISASAQGDLGFYSDSFSENLTLFSHTAPGQLWLRSEERRVGQAGRTGREPRDDKQITDAQ